MNKMDKYELMNQRAKAMAAAENALAEGNREEYETQMEIVKGMNEKIDAWEALEIEKGKHLQQHEKIGRERGYGGAGYEAAVKDLGEALRSNFRVKAVTQGSAFNTEHTQDGGYAVPEDIVTRIFELRDDQDSLLNEVTVHTVTAKSGRRTLKKRSQYAGFATVEEMAKYPNLTTPEFEAIEYNIVKRGGYTAATAEVYEYTDGEIAAFVETWLAKEAVATANRQILENLKGGSTETFANLDSILEAWCKLGSNFRGASKLITNDDGLAWLATLKDETGRYLLSPVINQTGTLQLAIGPYVMPVKVLANATLASTGTKVPVILGNLKEGIAYWQKKALDIKVSDVATVGTVNAYEQDLILYRGSIWSDCTTWDTDAWVYGEVDTDAV